MQDNARKFQKFLQHKINRNKCVDGIIRIVVENELLWPIVHFEHVGNRFRQIVLWGLFSILLPVCGMSDFQSCCQFFWQVKSYPNVKSWAAWVRDGTLPTQMFFFSWKNGSKVDFFQRTVSGKCRFSQCQDNIWRFQEHPTLSRRLRHPWSGSSLWEDFVLTKFFEIFRQKNLVASSTGNNPYISSKLPHICRTIL